MRFGCSEGRGGGRGGAQTDINVLLCLHTGLAGMSWHCLTVFVVKLGLIQRELELLKVDTCMNQLKQQL